MVSIFQKIGLLFVCLIVFAVEGKGQVLQTTNLNLNTGGVIYDVCDDPYHNCYIVVGDFTHINAIPVNNIAFINKSDFTVNTSDTLNSINSINGEIRSVALYFYETTSYWFYRLYLGGNFTTVQTNGDAAVIREGFVELQSTKTKLLPFLETAFSITTWSLNFDDSFWGPNSGVNEILLQGDTLILAGGFIFLAGQPYDGLCNIISFHPQIHAWYNGFFNTVDIDNQGYNFASGHVLSIVKANSYYYIAGSNNVGSTGSGFIVRCDPNGVYDQSYNSPLCCTYGSVWQNVYVESGSDNLLLSTFRQSGSGAGSIVHDEPTGALIDYSVGALGLLPYPYGIANYKNLTFTRSSNAIRVNEFNGIYPAPTIANITTNNPSFNSTTGGLADGFPLGGLGYRRMHIAENYLFVSGNLLTTVGGIPRVGLAIYCLEPLDAKTFTISDSTICSGDIRTFTIPPVDFADGYTWEYTGAGEDLQNNGSFEIGPIDIPLVSGNSIQVKFNNSVTSGQLKVKPYSICNGSTKIYSNTIVTNIVASQLPTINAGADVVLTCDVPITNLYGYSTSPGVTYEWIDPYYVTGQYDTVDQGDNYVFKVTNPVGCISFDTVHVTMDTIKPIAILPAPPYELTCSIPVQNFLGSSSTPNTTVEWYQGTTFFPNPITVSAPGGYFLLVTDTLNGCSPSSAPSIFVENNIAQPNITILGYANPNAIPLEILTCNLDTLNLTCSSGTLNTTVSWINADTTLFFGDNIDITNFGIYHIFATNNDNGCTNTLSISIESFFNAPGINCPNDNSLNCSVDSLSLLGSSLSVGSTFEWSGISIPLSTNPLTVYDTGTYYFTVTNPNNGCTSTDSIIVSETNEINVSAGNDLLVCDQSLVNLTASYTGTISGINYLWNTGSTSANEMYTAGNSPFAIVEIFGDNGCYGVDTVNLNLPPNPVINFQGFKPCDNSASGQIVASPVSGLEPFQYSIDNGLSYQTSPVFGGLFIGTYPIWVKDSVNCDYQFQAIIDGNSSLPEPNFLFSTYNFESDTVTIIDVSNPPVDSVIWEFPTELIVLDYNELSPTILLPDTGVFQITMNAFFGTCLVELTKPIYAALFDSTNANHYNQNGIKTIGLYPNPTSGNFTVTVEFYKTQRAAMVVQDMIGNTYVFNEYDETLTISQDIFLDLSVLDGTYVLKLISEFDSAYITFILAR